MLIAGIHAPQDSGAVERFCSWSHRFRDRTCLVFPKALPFVAISFAGDAREVAVAEGADGSFAVVIGEVYAIEGTQRAASTPPGSGGDAAAEVLRLWRQQGVEALRQLHGHAAVVLWDAAHERLVLGRDRSGVPPLFYGEHGRTLVWADEIKPLLALGLARALDLPALDAYLSMGYIPAPWTLIQAVRKVPPAHALVRSRENTSVTRYWWPPLQGRPERPSGGDVAALRARLEQSLRRRAGPGEHVGVLLSSGVDSSLVLAGLVRWVGTPVTAFTFHYEGYEGKWNEYERAHLLTQHLGVDHQIVRMDAAWVADHLTCLLGQYEEPFTYGLHTACMQAVKEAGIATVLSGALPGFPPVWELARTELLGLRAPLLPRAGWRMLARGARMVGARGGKAIDRIEALARLASGSVSALYEAKAVNTILRDATRLRLYRDPLLFHHGKAMRRERMEEIVAEVGAASRTDQLAFLGSSLLPAEHILWWNHRWGRTHGLRFRYPYFDHDVVALLAGLARAEPSKRVLREVAATVMPRDFAFYPKLGQAAPIWQWLRMAPLKDLVLGTLTADRLEQFGLFRSDVVLQAVSEHMRGDVHHPWLLWTLMSLVLWKEHVLDGTPVEHPTGASPVLP